MEGAHVEEFALVLCRRNRKKNDVSNLKKKLKFLLLVCQKVTKQLAMADVSNDNDVSGISEKVCKRLNLFC